MFTPRGPKAAATPLPRPAKGETAVSAWLVIAILTALGGALILWHSVSQTKHVSEQLLRTYRQMLAQARDERSRKPAEGSRSEADKKGSGARDRGAGRPSSAE